MSHPTGSDGTPSLLSLFNEDLRLDFRSFDSESVFYPLVKPIPPPTSLYTSMLLSPPIAPSLNDLVEAQVPLPHHVTDTDFNSLASNSGLLTDGVMNAMCRLFQQRAHPHQGSPPTTIVFSSFFFAQFLQGTAPGHGPLQHSDFHYVYQFNPQYAKLRPITWKGVAPPPMHLCAHLLFPISNGAHWTLLHADLVERKLEYFDSLHGNGEGYMKLLLRFLSDYARMHKTVSAPVASSYYSFDNWTVDRMAAPEVLQHDSISCGVYTLLFADLVTSGHSRPCSVSANDSCIPTLRAYYARSMLLWYLPTLHYDVSLYTPAVTRVQPESGSHPPSPAALDITPNIAVLTDDTSTAKANGSTKLITGADLTTE